MRLPRISSPVPPAPVQHWNKLHPDSPSQAPLSHLFHPNQSHLSRQHHLLRLCCLLCSSSQFHPVAHCHHLRHHLPLLPHHQS
jgi:hypothetical protein